MAEYGLALGLSQDLGYDQRINDLYKKQEMMRLAHEASNQKAEMFANDLDFTEGGNAFDAPLVKQKAYETINKIGQIARTNPNWESDIAALTQIKMYRKELKSNEHITRAMITNDNFKKLNADMQTAAKDPNQHNIKAYEDELNRYRNYEAYGHPEGKEAAEKEGLKPFLYNKPKDFIDINESFYNIGNKFQDKKTRNIKGGFGAFEEYANPDALKLVSAQLYSQNKYQIDQAAAKQGMKPLDYVMAGINAHIPKKRDMGDYGLFKQKYLLDYENKLKGTGGEAANTYKTAIVDQMASQVPASAMGRIAKDAKTYLIAKDGSQIDFTGLVEPKFTGFNFYAHPEEVERKFTNQKHDDGKARLRFAESVSFIPMEVAKDNGIVTGGLGWFSDPEVKDNYKGKAEIVKKTGEDGKVHKAVKLTLHSPFDVNGSANAGMFNTEVMTSKQVPLPESNYQKGQQYAVPSASVSEWKSAGWNEEQIKRAVNEGRINIK